MNKKVPKLSLAKETLRTLDLSSVAGATFLACSNNCSMTPPLRGCSGCDTCVPCPP